MVRKLFLAMVTALTAAALAVGFAAAPVAAAPVAAAPVATAPAARPVLAGPATRDAQIQVKRGLYLTLDFCMAAGALGVVRGDWDRWLCSRQLLVGWRLYTNR